MKWITRQGAPADWPTRYAYDDLPDIVTIPSVVTLKNDDGDSLKVRIDENSSVHLREIGRDGQFNFNLNKGDVVLHCGYEQQDGDLGITFYFLPGGPKVRRAGTQLTVDAIGDTPFLITATAYELPAETGPDDRDVSNPAGSPLEANMTKTVDGSAMFIGVLDDRELGIAGLRYHFARHSAGKSFGRVIVGPLFLEF